MAFDINVEMSEELFSDDIKTIERMGVSAIIIEDKVGLKKNSLFGTGGNIEYHPFYQNAGKRNTLSSMNKTFKLHIRNF